MATKSISVVSLNVLAVFLLAACGGNSSQGSQGGEPDPSEPVELVFYSGGGDKPDSFNARFGDALRKKFPDYSLKLIQQAASNMSIQDVIASGEKIDIFYGSIGSFPAHVTETNLQLDMSELVKKHQIDLNRFEPTLIDAIRSISGGKLYGLPLFNNVMVTYYNNELFQKFGVPLPKDGMSWEETLQIADKMTRKEGDKQYIGLVVSPTHVLRLNQFSLPYVDAKTNKATINSDLWKTLYQTYYIAPAGNQGYKDRIGALTNKLPYKDDFLKEQNLAMFVYLSDLQTTLPKEIAGMDWDLVSMPTFKEKPDIGSQSYPTFISLTNLSQNQDAAMRVVNYLTSEEYQLEASKNAIMPVLQSNEVKQAFGQGTEFKNKNFKAVFYNKPAPISVKTRYDDAAEKKYIAPLVNVSLGSVDINTALRTAEEEANKAIEEMKQSGK